VGPKYGDGFLRRLLGWEGNLTCSAGTNLSEKVGKGRHESDYETGRPVDRGAKA